MHESAKELIDERIKFYKKIVEENRINTYNEESTKKDFILPLFKALGWKTDDSSEVTAEEKISKKRVDYGFRINGIPKFYLEAKPLKENLENPTFVEQAINYAWLKGCTWAVLTNFESVGIFNAEWKAIHPLHSHLKTIYYYEFLDRFDDLWLLSKESFKNDLLDKEAEKWAKKTKKVPVDKQLLDDFTRFRESLSKNITKLNKDISETELDESIQRILDRLIFIRNCEDRELEAKNLLSNLRIWVSRGKGQLIKSLRKEVFDYFGTQYNSKIFTKHLCDDIEIDNEILSEIIEGLYYTIDKSIYYDFSAIEADVMGNIYEQYLSHILKKTEKRAKLIENHIHKKERGIFYTPTYIVDFIVRNTLSELLQAKRTNVEKIRVLDPACGSGSFLIKAFDIFNEYYRKKDKDYSQTEFDTTGTGITYSKKLKILQDNIFGVDLDKQAVEITQLNLLLKIAEKGKRLPLLEDNIKCGNSIIDDELVANKKAFKWNEEFYDAMQEGGFDVVIGNPPYVAYYSRQKKDLSDLERGYYKNAYNFIIQKDKIGSFNTIMFFIERGLNILKDNGLLCFIIDIGIFEKAYTDIRRYILTHSKILKLVTDLEEFETVGSGQIIILLQKCSDYKKLAKNSIKYQKGINGEIQKIPQIKWMESKEQKFEFIDTPIGEMLSKIEKDCFLLGEYYDVICGLEFGALRDLFLSDNKIDDTYHPVINGSRDLSKRYHMHWNKNTWVKFDKDFEECLVQQKKNISKTGKKVIFASGKEYRFIQPKLIIRQSALSLIASYDDSNLYCLRSLHTITPKNVTPVDLKYLLGLINSNLATFYALKKGIIRYQKGKQPQIRTNDLELFPIKYTSTNNQLSIINLVNEILSLNGRLIEIGENKTPSGKFRAL